MATAACTAERLPLKESGATTTQAGVAHGDGRAEPDQLLALVLPLEDAEQRGGRVLQPVDHVHPVLEPARRAASRRGPSTASPARAR